MVSNAMINSQAQDLRLALPLLYKSSSTCLVAMESFTVVLLTGMILLGQAHERRTEAKVRSRRWKAFRSVVEGTPL